MIYFRAPELCDPVDSGALDRALDHQQHRPLGVLDERGGKLRLYGAGGLDLFQKEVHGRRGPGPGGGYGVHDRLHADLELHRDALLHDHGPHYGRSGEAEDRRRDADHGVFALQPDQGRHERRPGHAAV